MKNYTGVGRYQYRTSFTQQALLRKAITASSAKWMNDARCKEVDPELWNPTTDESGDKNTHLAAIAKRICAQCEVRFECLEHALEYHEYGVWGGTTERERMVIRRNRKSGGAR